MKTDMNKAFSFLVYGIALSLSSMSVSNCAAQSKTSEKWLHVTVCDLIKDQHYDGSRVTFHAKVLDGHFHGILLRDDRCEKGLRMSASSSVREQADYKDFMRTLYLLRESTTDHVITADFYGKLVYRRAEPRLKWVLDVERISNIVLK